MSKTADCVGDVHKIFSSLRSGWAFSKNDWDMAEVINEAEKQLVGVVQRLSKENKHLGELYDTARQNGHKVERKLEEAEGKLTQIQEHLKEFPKTAEGENRDEADLWFDKLKKILEET